MFGMLLSAVDLCREEGGKLTSMILSDQLGDVIKRMQKLGVRVHNTFNLSI